MDEDTVALNPSISAPIHPVTTSLYISNLVRPLATSQLKSHLLSLADPSSSSPNPSSMTHFHLDGLRTHAFATFTTLSSAIRVRNALHATTYPPEPQRRALNVDFVPTDLVPQWISTETDTTSDPSSSGSGPPRASRQKRWEVLYTTSPSGSITANLQPIGPNVRPSGPEPTPSTASAPKDPPSIPTGPSNKPTSATTAHNPPPILFPASPTDSFNRTSTQPLLFHRPVSPSMASARLAALSAATNADWDARADHERYQRGSAGYGLGATASMEGLRRITFQDGDEVVDGGAEFGGGKAFGRERGRGAGGGRRYGGGTGGGDRFYAGGRGGQGRRGYDSYTGGGGGAYSGPGRPRADTDWHRDRY